MISLDNHVSDIEQKGYTILHNLISREVVLKIKTALVPWLQQEYFGRNDFEGIKSERVYALLAKDPVFALIVEHPTVLSLVDKFLDPSYLLSANLAINVHPEETPQPVHADHASLPNCDRRTLQGMSTIWAFDDFTDTNGATEVLEGSHLWQEGHANNTVSYKKVMMKAGSVLVFHGSLLHRGGANKSDKNRLAITPQYCQPWLRQLENMVLSVPPTIAANLSDRIQELLGYSIREPGFMGYVDGLHPKRLLNNGYKGRGRS